MIDSQTQLYINVLNSRRSVDIDRSYPRGHRGDRVAMGFYHQVSFKLFPEGGNRFWTAYIVGKVI